MVSFNIVLRKAGIELTYLEYIKKQSITIFIVAILFIISLFFEIIFGIAITGLSIIILIALGITIIIAIIFPFSKINSRANEINDILPLMVTYLGGISTSKASRDQLFKYCGEKKEEFGLAAEEMKRVRTLATEWNFGYPAALTIVGKTTPSEPLNDFLGRYSQALEAGEDLEQFFRKEQKSALDAYISGYRRSLNSLEIITEAYQALNISYIFLTLTSLILTMLFGSSDVVNTLITNILLLILINFPLLLAIKTRAYSDPLTSFKYNQLTLEKLNQLTLVMFAIILPMVLAMAIVFRISFWLILILVGMIILPVGIAADNMEKLVVRRDHDFPVFIRTLGGTAEAMGGTTLLSLRSMESQKLGPLTENIKRVVARLEFGIDDQVAWDAFIVETGSSIIQKFVRIYLETMSIGGGANQTSLFVSDNVERILEVRRDRDQKISAMKGLIYPMHVTSVGIMIFMAQIIILLTQVISSGSSAQSDSGLGFFGSQSDTSDVLITVFFNIIIVLLTFFNALAITLPKQGLLRTMFRSMGLMFIVSGFTILLIGNVAESMFSGFLEGFDS